MTIVFSLTLCSAARTRTTTLLLAGLLSIPGCSSESDDEPVAGTTTAADPNSPPEDEDDALPEDEEVEGVTSSGGAGVTSTSSPDDEEPPGPEFDPDQRAVILDEEGFVIFASSSPVTCAQDYDDCGAGSAVRITLPEPVMPGVYDAAADDVNVLVVADWVNDCNGNGEEFGNILIVAGEVEVLSSKDSAVTFVMRGFASEDSQEFPAIEGLELSAVGCDGR